MLHETPDIDTLSEPELRALASRLMGQLQHQNALLEKLTLECAMLKRLKFAAKSEALPSEQRSLLQDDVEADLQALAQEIEQLEPTPAQAPADSSRQTPKRQSLPAQLPRQEFRHEPDSSVCNCGQPLKRIGEDVAEKLDYVPGVFTVHRHIRGKWACACCQTLRQAPVAPHIIDKGLPTTGLLAQVLVAKYADHLPLYRQEAIYARAGVPLARSTLAQWVGSCGVQLQPLVDALRQVVLGHGVIHADETPVQMLKPASLKDGKTHRAYLWAYTPGKHEAA
jgi:transposase